VAELDEYIGFSVVNSIRKILQLKSLAEGCINPAVLMVLL
jgi:hypothetical protein